MDILLIQILKLTLSVLLGLFIGFERTQQNKPTGMRDVALVSLGATLFAIIGLQFSAPTNMDMTRLLYAPIIGIGFLGSGAILKTKNKTEGITSASVLWAMVAIGLLCGVGDYILALVASIFVYFVLKLKHISIIIKSKRKKKHGRNCNKKKRSSDRV